MKNLKVSPKINPRFWIYFIRYNNDIWSHDELNQSTKYFITVAIKTLPESITLLSAVVLLGTVLNPLLISAIISIVYLTYFSDRWLESLSQLEMQVYIPETMLKKFFKSPEERRPLIARGFLYIFLISVAFLGLAFILSTSLIIQKR
jgi:hypothetical protein